MNKNLIDKDLLEKVQKSFCRANDVYLLCLDRDWNIITSRFGSEEEHDFMKQFQPDDMNERLVQAVEMSRVETMVEIDCKVPFIKMCGIINRMNDSVALIWLVVGVLEEYLPEDMAVPESLVITTENHFYRSLAFLETISKYVFVIKENQYKAQLAMEQAVAAEELYKTQMQHSDAMTQIMQMLESSNAFSQITDEAIRKVCQAFDIEGGCLLQLNADGHTVDAICEFNSDPHWTLAEKLQGKLQISLPFFDGKPYMLSSDSMMRDDLETFFIRYHLSAGVFQPLEINGRNDMYLCFYNFEKERIWSMEDIKFITDVKRVIQGILERRIAKNSLAGSYASLEAILENVGCSIYVVDYVNKEVLYTNQAFRTLMKSDIDQAGLNEYFFSKESEVLEIPSMEVFLERNDLWLEMSQTKIQWVDGRTVYLGTIYDITEKKRYQLDVERQVNNDTLTGLYNRKRAEMDLDICIKEAVKTKTKGAVVCINIDDFKHINEGLGYQFGDTLLKAIAHNISHVAGIKGNCYRVSGDEFAIIIHGDAYQSLDRIMDELRMIFSKPWYLKGEDYYCTVSMGVVCFPEDGSTMDDVIRKVDVALATAKKNGKNCIEYYNNKVEETSFNRLDLEQNMRRATMNACNEFEVYYQPIFVHTENETKCCGAEALVRWNSTELGFIPPSDFIPLAEYLGLINPIGEHVLHEALKRCKYWNDCGHPDYKVNVNISVIQLLQGDFVKKVKKALEETKVIPGNVTLEVTESLAINDMTRMKKVLAQVKALGVRVAMDDFGTGYSSLNHIRELPIDVIKIDRCFVENLAEDQYSGAFVKMVSELAHTIDMYVCVEGVEHRKQLEALRGMHVQMVQGYYYGKPMPVNEFEKIYL